MIKGVLEKMEYLPYNNDENAGFFIKTIYKKSDMVTLVAVCFEKHVHFFKDFMFRIEGMKFDIYADFRFDKKITQKYNKKITHNVVWLTMDKLYKIEIAT